MGDNKVSDGSDSAESQITNYRLVNWWGSCGCGKGKAMWGKGSIIVIDQSSQRTKTISSVQHPCFLEATLVLQKVF
jgi:hypothetical protein